MKRTIMIGGAAGEGINTVEMYIEKRLKQEGYEVYSYKNYMSRIRGGYNFSTITISDEAVYSVEEHADWYIPLNAEALAHAKTHLNQRGCVLASAALSNENDKDLPVVWVEEEKIGKSKNAFGMVAVGYILKTFGASEDALDKLFNVKWSEQINKENKRLAKVGYEMGTHKHTSTQSDKNRIILNGNQAVALGALSAGLGFYCAYPMAPSTGIMNYLAANDESSKIIVEQAEDEIAAAVAAIGAASNGVRAMTGTSGGGFSLMVEALGFAAVAEVPVVICNVQRPGPATGLPTRTEQADLSFIVSASQGEFSRIVLAPKTIEEAFYTTFRAFNLADKYQVPVLILTDQLLADSVQSVPKFDTSKLKIERHVLEDIVKDYQRYDMENISGNRKYPGIDDETIIMTDSHVHDPYGYITESEKYANALKMKFLNRTEAIKDELNAPAFYGDLSYKELFICWGSTYGAAKEAVDALNAQGNHIGLLAFTDVYPLREDLLDEYVHKDTQIYNIEGNGTNQFGKLLRMETGIKWHHSILKYDGRPFTKSFIMKAYEVINNDSNNSN